MIGLLVDELTDKVDVRALVEGALFESMGAYTSTALDDDRAKKKPKNGLPES